MKMYLSGILIVVKLIVFCNLLSVHVRAAGLYENGKFLGVYPFPSQTPDPININTTNVHPIKTVPLILRFDYNEIMMMRNNGTFEVTTYQKKETGTSVEGGYFEKFVKYYLHRFNFYFNDKKNEDGGGTINKKGGPLEIVVLYFKKELYGSFEEALKHRDGICKIIYPIYICKSRNNPYYGQLAAALKKIRDPGTRAEVKLGDLMRVFNSAQVLSRNFYSYPGAYTDDEGNAHNCATNHVLSSHENYCLSQEELNETFELIRNSDGEHFNNPAPQSDIERPVVQGSEVYSIDGDQTETQ